MPNERWGRAPAGRRSGGSKDAGFAANAGWHRHRMVVVGELTDAGGPQERGIIGRDAEPRGAFARGAEPNQVIIAESTRRLLGNLFELKHLGTKDLKGIAEPVRVWAVLR